MPVFDYSNALYVQKLHYQITEAMPNIDNTDLMLTNPNTGVTLASGLIALTAAGGPGAPGYFFTFPGVSNVSPGVLPDGNYHAVLLSSGISDVAGNALSAATSRPMMTFFHETTRIFMRSIIGCSGKNI